MFKKISLIFTLGALYALSFTSCTEAQQKSFQPVPSAIGLENRLLVVAEKDVWQGELIDSFRNYFQRPFLLLPQPEPILNITHIEPSEFHSSRKKFRTIMFLGDITDGSRTSNVIKSAIGKERSEEAKKNTAISMAAQDNKWADGQLVLYLFSNSRANLIKSVVNNANQIIAKISAHDRPRIRKNAFASGHHKIAENKVETNLQIQLGVPLSYRVAAEEDNMMWFRMETDEISSNIIIHTFDYTDQSQLTYQNLMAIRDSLGKKFVHSDIKNSYMYSSDKHLPIIYNHLSLNGYYALEARGVWSMKNDFMGGPFLSYLVHDKDNNKIVFLDGFVYAPGEEKRKLMQFLEVIFENIRILNTVKN